MSTATKVKHSVKVGDIFSSSWGYDQTNVDWAEVVKVTPSSVYLRRIRSGMADDGRHVVPVPGSYFTEPEIHRVQSYFDRDGTEHVWLHRNSYSCWSPSDGSPQYDTIAAGDVGH